MKRGFVGVLVTIIGALVLSTSAIHLKHSFDDQIAQLNRANQQIEELNTELQDAKFGAFRPSGYTGKLLTRLTEGGAESSFNTTPCTTPDGQIINTAALGDYVVITVNPGAANEEKISASAVSCSGTTATWTIANRGLSFASPTSTLSANKEQHAIGETVIISDDDHFLYQQYPSVDEDETITGSWSFPTPTIGANPATKTYVDGAAFGGIGNASETATGTVEIATQTETASSTQSGSLGRLAIPASVATSTWHSATAALRVVITQNNGKIDNNFLSTSTLFTNPTFSGNVTITPTSIFDSSGNQVLWTFIASTSLDSAQTVTFTARQHLRGYIHSEGVTSGTGRVCLRFNGDSAINYAYNASTTVATGQTSLCLDTAAGGDRVSDHFFEIINPSNTSKRVIGFTTQGISSSTVPMPVTIAGVWATSTAQQINKITVPPDNAFRTGSVFYLYGSSY